ncbi:MAG: hypothetical protein MRY74_05135 [Neomegalonema sp.]|nr:hypothetical protein [Neomegalonema sp.]
MLSIILRIGVVIAASTALAGGGWIHSKAPAVPNAPNPKAAKLVSGLYCAVSADGAAKRGRYCARAWTRGGRLYLRDENGARLRVMITPLTRAASLAQFQAARVSQRKSGYALGVVIIRKDGFMLVPLLHLTDDARRAAAAAGVTLAKDTTEVGVRIISGDTGAITKWLSHVVGRQFDHALRSRTLFKKLRAKAVTVVRLADADGVKATPEQIKSAIEDVKRAFQFSITLE